MIYRTITNKILALAEKLPVISVVGPRQSGKTTLVRKIFENHVYVSLENPDIRRLALSDPKKIFENYTNEHGIILDEIQRAPELLSYIQCYSDENERPGYFVITGSQNLLVNEAITQTLAGRVAIFTLLPLSTNELKNSNLLPSEVDDAILMGQYPRIFAKKLDPNDWYPVYVHTYLERDVRSIQQVKDLTTFQRFIALCASRIGQILDIPGLASDCKVDVPTANSWISLLEATYIIFLMQPYHKNFGKQLIKAPKLYFYDTGLASFILKIRTAEEIKNHPLRGGLMETLVISDLYKQRFNKGLQPDCHFWRDQQGHEVDCLLSHKQTAIPIEIKANKNISTRYFDNVKQWTDLAGTNIEDGVVVYAGDENKDLAAGRLVSWKSLDTI